MRQIYQSAYREHGKGFFAYSEAELWFEACMRPNSPCPYEFLLMMSDPGLMGNPSGFDKLTKSDDGERLNLIVGSGTLRGEGGHGYLRSLLDPESMVGATEDEVRSMVPDNWIEEPSVKGDGVRWLSPKQGQYGSVRYLRGGMPKTIDPLHQGGDYFDVRLGGLQYRVAGSGNVVIDDPAIPSFQIDGNGRVGRLFPGGKPGEGVKDIPLPEVP